MKVGFYNEKHCLLLVFLFLFFCQILYASEEVQKNSQADISAPEKDLDDLALEVAEEIQITLSDQLIDFSNSIDNFFVEERMEDEGSRSRVVISFLTATDHEGMITSEYLIRARLNFPKTQNKLRLVVESSLESESDSSQLDIVNDLESASDAADYSTALQFVFKETKFWQASTNAGVRFSDPIDPFLRLRLRRLFFVNKWEVRVTETITGYQHQGLEEVTGFDFERLVTDSTFFRASSRFILSDQENDFLFTQGFSLFQRISEKRGLVYTLGKEAIIDNPMEVTRYYVNFRYRCNFYKNWAFYEIVPELSWLREDDFDVSPSVLFRLDFVVGKIKK